jgi:hypothetical protein
MAAAGLTARFVTTKTSEPDRGAIMHGFINSPALAKLVALQMVDEEVNGRRRSTTHRPLRARLAVRRTVRGGARAQAPRVSATGKLAEEH